MNLFLRSKKEQKQADLTKKHNFHFKHVKIRYKNNIEKTFLYEFLLFWKVLDFRKVYDAFFESSKDWKDENDQNRNVIPLKNVFIWRLSETFWAIAYLEFDKNPIIERFHQFSAMFEPITSKMIIASGPKYSKCRNIKPVIHHWSMNWLGLSIMWDRLKLFKP